MQGFPASGATQRLGDRARGNMRQRGPADEYERIALLTIEPIEQIDRLAGERHDMRLAPLHASRRKAPQPLLKSELAPGSLDYLGKAAPRQNEEAQGLRTHIRIDGERGHERRYVLVGNRRVILDRR